MLLEVPVVLCRAGGLGHFRALRNGESPGLRAAPIRKGRKFFRRAEGGDVLDEILALPKNKAGWKLTIEGHTDAVGSDAQSRRVERVLD